MIFKLSMEFNDSGEVSSLSCRGVEFIAPGRSCELFILQLRDEHGVPLRLSSRRFTKVEMLCSNRTYTLLFSGCTQLPEALVNVTAELGADTISWTIAGDTGSSGFRWEWVDFPRIRMREIPDGKYLLPFAEGALVEDLKKRNQKGFFSPEYAEYPMTGVSSFYPGPAAMQFEAFYTPECGIGFYCFDPAHTPKTVDMVADLDGGVCLMLQHFTGGENRLAGKVVFAAFHGDWQDAAEIYRKWMERSDPSLPRPLEERMPEWFRESPVLLIYPVKGRGLDLGGMEPNEYFPYANALPVVEGFQERWQSPVMPLLMHWEGTAPWAPPYIWPPYGGEAMLREFIQKLHRNGNFAGLYGSGIAWTQRSKIDLRYECFDRFEDEHVADEICIGPAGETCSRVCQGQRMGYDLCPARQFTRRTVCGEIASAAGVGVDYLQYFDQNQGGAAPLCYSRRHVHPDIPGAWQTAAMQTLLEDAAQAAGRTVLGCENGAAEPYLKRCMLNDLRNHLAWGTNGMPVPLYSYLFHEYVSGFSGNGVSLSNWVDVEQTPFFLQWSLAWNFACGNLLSVVLKDHGTIHWHWALPWSAEAPDQEPLLTLIRNLNQWRRGAAAAYLVAGRMVKTPENVSTFRTIHLKHRPSCRVPAVIVSAWESHGKHAVILVNYGSEAESCRIRCGGMAAGTAVSREKRVRVEGEELSFDVPPLDMILLELEPIPASAAMLCEEAVLL